MDVAAQKAAERFGVPVDLIRAVIRVESGGDRWAMRYEPRFQWLWDIERGASFDGDDPDAMPSIQPASSPTEYHAQRTSFGLMQVMGATARQLGFDRPFLTALCELDTGIEYGCRYLARLYDEYGDWEKAAAAYNAGSPRRMDSGEWENQGYIDRLREAGWQG